MTKYLALILTLTLAVVFAACGDEPASNSPQQTTGNTATTAENVGPVATATPDPNDSPTAAYKRLFAAVKSKNTEAIKAEYSKNSIAAAQAQATRANVSLDDVYRNGFTRTTFADQIPEIRDERVKDNMGAVEVWSVREKKWEDLPFIREGANWKLAVGDVFAGNWKSPGRGRASREQEAANVTRGNSMIKMNSANVDFNAVPMRNTNSNAKTRP